mmetsp:Transcript_84622/g.238007  ORF Transcript_84622/g.238007 Transcript_84622/m.238007 type:complete len:231 (-) Transcript_84622:291-983(-)
MLAKRSSRNVSGNLLVTWYSSPQLLHRNANEAAAPAARPLHPAEDLPLAQVSQPRQPPSRCSRQARCARWGQLAQGRAQRCRKCCGAGPGGATSMTSQRRHRAMRVSPWFCARTRQTTCHVNDGGSGTGGAAVSLSMRRRMRIIGRNQKRWSREDRAPQNPAAKKRGSGQGSSPQERMMRISVLCDTPCSDPQRSTNRARQMPSRPYPEETTAEVQASCETSVASRKAHK